MTSPDPVAHWAASGAMSLTGRADGPPHLAPGNPAGHLVAALDRLTAEPGPGPALPDVRLLGERAAIAGFYRLGPRSAGGAFRTVRTSDGWLGLSLARDEDVDLVPALVEDALPDDGGGEGVAWVAVRRWAREVSTAEADARVRLLDLPGRAVAGHGAPPRAARPGVVRRTGGSRSVGDRPLVVDLSSLWAGPLATHLLGLLGARVVKVESVHRPDGARRGPAAFYDLLHAGHDAVALDFTDCGDRDRLRDLVSRADLVVEASRPRALARLGVDADSLVDAGTSWLSITAEGRDVDAIGFGDDVATGAGLVVDDGENLLPCGDALADPLTGVVAATAAWETLRGPRAHLLDVSMYDVCRDAVGDGRTVPYEVRRRGEAWVCESDSGTVKVAAPYARPVRGRAPATGADTGRWCP